LTLSSAGATKRQSIAKCAAAVTAALRTIIAQLQLRLCPPELKLTAKNVWKLSSKGNKMDFLKTAEHLFENERTQEAGVASLIAIGYCLNDIAMHLRELTAAENEGDVNIPSFAWVETLDRRIERLERISNK
jgi:hypothetical protein